MPLPQSGHLALAMRRPLSFTMISAPETFFLPLHFRQWISPVKVSAMVDPLSLMAPSRERLS